MVILTYTLSRHRLRSNGSVLYTNEFSSLCDAGQCSAWPGHLQASISEFTRGRKPLRLEAPLAVGKLSHFRLPRHIWRSPYRAGVRY